MYLDDLIYVGLNSHVLALRKSDGEEVWSTKLKGALSMGDKFVTFLVDGDRLFAHTKGELFCLDALSGRVLWTHELAGLRYDIASLATKTVSQSPGNVAKRRNSDGGGGGDGGD
jgi:outer membrane protein assembly factor BamB